MVVLVGVAVVVVVGGAVVWMRTAVGQSRGRVFGIQLLLPIQTTAGRGVCVLFMLLVAATGGWIGVSPVLSIVHVATFIAPCAVTTLVVVAPFVDLGLVVARSLACLTLFSSGQCVVQSGTEIPGTHFIDPRICGFDNPAAVAFATDRGWLIGWMGGLGVLGVVGFVGYVGFEISWSLPLRYPGCCVDVVGTAVVHGRCPGFGFD